MKLINTVLLTAFTALVFSQEPQGLPVLQEGKAYFPYIPMWLDKSGSDPKIVGQSRVLSQLETVALKEQLKEDMYLEKDGRLFLLATIYFDTEYIFNLTSHAKIMKSALDKTFIIKDFGEQ